MPTELNKTQKFITDNWKWLLAMLLYVPIGYAQYKSMQSTVESNKNRLRTWIERVEKRDKIIHDLELRITVLETTDCK